MEAVPYSSSSEEMELDDEVSAVDLVVSKCLTARADAKAETGNNSRQPCLPPFRPFAASVARSESVPHSHRTQRRAPAFRLLCIKADTITHSNEDTYDYDRAISEFRVAWSAAFWPLGSAHESSAAVAVLAGLVDVHNEGGLYFDPHKWSTSVTKPLQAEPEASTGAVVTASGGDDDDGTDDDDDEGPEEDVATPPPPSTCTIA
jgi:hypothetical protein